ncbi:hypothetical protein F558DRAFT_06190 [Streptomyces sp. AmelKG-A3]|nr:hypothetical protein [Streptomyces sp. SID4941]SCE02707.1 hypothetical protein GA0115247_12075 [Streptomyces sp. PalvLS-984]SDE41039.1 hypothetical protein F558DRAFT_06190 [Streptomyces sp. AmelKG-A3]
MICVDCDRTIVGPAVLAAAGQSMSGARPDMWAHPPRSPECQPRVPSKQLLRKAMAEIASKPRLKY